MSGTVPLAALPDGYTAAETNYGNLTHAAETGSGQTLCGRAVFSFLSVERWPVECPRCIKQVSNQHGGGEA
ncbi:hypothetical protein [Catenuloplanes indicus]|uniref:Uncharacterized protein n=1 Tax=Catenuloplanes indicus TaxID=137267 RepID=A0AAE4AV71_9ACTN|nr:hypothetical protein [Catenuloplanes indicus]MDQ0363421.1 hypothetical protein [Catenuloplanes indicus]